MNLRNIIETYENENYENKNYEIKNYTGLYRDYKAALWVALERGIDGKGVGAFGNDYAIMTFNSDCFCFYVVSNTLMRSAKSPDILFKMVLPYEDITKLKVGKSLIWCSLKIWFSDENDKTYKIKVVISKKVLGIKNQNENVEFLLNFIETKGF